MSFFRALLWFYPSSFRAEYGGEMSAIFQKRLQQASGLTTRMCLWIEAVREAIGGAASVHWEILLRDLRYAERTLRRSPGFVLTAIPVVALGIGANTAAFSVADFVLMRPLPYADSDRLVKVWESIPQYERMEPSPANYRDWKRLSTAAFSDMSATHFEAYNMVGQGDPQRVEAASATADLAATLGVHPLLGRFFSPADDRAGAPGTVVLSYQLWRSEFGGDPRVLGRRLMLDGQPYVVIGVMRRDFQYPRRDTQLWTAERFDADAYADRTNTYLGVVARLRPGVSLTQAQAQMSVIAAQLERQFPKENEKTAASVIGLRDELSDRTRVLILGLCGAALCVLLIACANLANLLLVRALARRKELDVRTALGAGREQLARQLATESLGLAAVGGLLGVLVAFLALPLFSRLVPNALPIAEAPAIDLRVLAFAGVLTALTGIVFGMVPVLRMDRDASLEGLRQGARSGFGQKQRLRAVLVVGEVTVSVVLLVCTGLLMRSLLQLRAIDPGFRAASVMTLRTELPSPKYAPAEKRHAYYSRVLAEVRALPGVSAAGFVSGLPMVWYGGIWDVVVPGRLHEAAAADKAVLRYATPGYFDTMSIPLKIGREMRDSDTRATLWVAVVSASFADRYWPHQDPLGRHFEIAFHDRTVVGVVGDIRNRGFERATEPQVYLPNRQVPDGWLIFYEPKDLAVRTSLRPEAIAPALRRIVHAADPEQAISNVRPMEEVVAGETMARAVQLRALLGFAAVAFLLAGIGIHGLLAFAVSQRANEFGVRIALGARSRDILSMVARQGAVLGALGVFAGIALAYVAARSMTAALSGVDPGDSVTYLAAAGLCLAMTATGSLLPARRAALIDPAVVMRGEA